ncbi:MAG TPA: prenyltransferase, partial [Gammaproteobacteria bacterium]|nr:prenyltransferase [Gammaproteobacteria bacterium]
MSSAEPAIEQFPNRLTAYLMAVRPPFIFASIVPILLGLSFTRYSGHSVDGMAAMLTLVAGILLHAAINVLNDYHDSRNGTDRLNTERIYPFTGGSRFIQNGVLGEQQMLRWGLLLLLATVAIGLYLIARTGS